MLTYTERRGREQMDGVEILRWRIRLPRWDQWEGLSRFYEQIAESTEKFCKEELKDQALLAYEASEDPKKKFYFPVFHYSLIGRVTYEKEPLLSIRLDASLCSGKTLSERTTLGQIIQTEEGVFLSPAEALKSLNGTRLPRGTGREMGSALIENGRLLLRRENQWAEWE